MTNANALYTTTYRVYTPEGELIGETILTSDDNRNAVRNFREAFEEITGLQAEKSYGPDDPQGFTHLVFWDADVDSLEFGEPYYWMRGIVRDDAEWLDNGPLTQPNQ